MSKTVLDLNASEMREFFLQSDRYCTVKLPKYFCFTNLLKNLYEHIKKKTESSIVQDCKKAGNFEHISYEITVDKNGGLDWRKLQLIHPFLYVSLLRVLEIHWNGLQERFACFKQDNILCASIPIVPDNRRSDFKEMVLNWDEKVVHISLSFLLEYSCLIRTDITNCYNSVYTHAVEWALNGKEFSKQEVLGKTDKNQKKKKENVGKVIDTLLRYMHYRQTNGIPQGSVLMDFIAELVLGYVDIKLTEAIGKARINSYKIIRYRDDYRIFTKNSDDGNAILKILSEVLSEFGFKLNAQKTFVTEDLVNGVFKKDRLELILEPLRVSTGLEQLIRIYNFGQKFPNSGQIVKLLSGYRYTLNKWLSKRKISDTQITELVAIVTNIANKNPRTYPVCMNIVSFLTDQYSCDEQKKDIIEKIKNKLSGGTRRELLEIWMQRLTLKFGYEQSTSSQLCQLINRNNDTSGLFDISWLPNEIQNIFRKIPVIDRNVIEKMPPVIGKNETDDFNEY